MAPYATHHLGQAEIGADCAASTGMIRPDIGECDQPRGRSCSEAALQRRQRRIASRYCQPCC